MRVIEKQKSDPADAGVLLPVPSLSASPAMSLHTMTFRLPGQFSILRLCFLTPTTFFWWSSIYLFWVCSSPHLFSLKSMFSAIERFQGPRRTLYSILPETSCSCMWNNSFTHSERFSIDISLKNAPSVSPHTLYRFGTLLLFPQSLCFGIVHVHCSSIGYDLWSCHGNSVSFITL